MSYELVANELRKLRLVTVSPNQEVHEAVAGYLETPYERPLKIVPNGLNRWALAMNALYYWDPVLMQLCKSRPAGKYLDNYNAYLRRKPNDPLGDAHEETHAAARVINPELGRGLVDFLGMFKTLKEGDMFSCEKPAVYNCVQEGVADAVAIQVGLGSKDSSFRRAAEQRDQMLLHGDLTMTPEYALPILDRSIDMMDKGLADFNLKHTWVLYKILWLQQDISYTIGYSFVTKAAGALVANRVDSYPGALKRVLKSPPATVSDLKDPMEYASRISSF